MADKKITDGFKGERAIILPYGIRNFQAQNKFTKSLYVTHIGYYPYAKYHFKERPEGTNENILIFCESGNGQIILDKESFTLTPNSIFVIPENTPHAYMADKQSPWSIFWIHFKGSTEKYFSIYGKILTEESRLKEREQLFEEIFQTLEMGYSTDNLEYCSACLHYFLASLKYSKQFTKVKDMVKTDAIPKSILFMKDNLGNRITLKDIAEHVNYSPSHFGALFLEKTSFPPIDYYNQLKIQKACSLLQFSEMHVKEIAEYLGYYDQFHFSKAFKKEMGMSPLEYRKLYQ